ncbi:IQ domain-containing protein K-like [Leptidea sinapis]|uniref:IQ domain-containing protein K-like n=1 Tax=Leptidea sinapis TaxID=189913 RepID=UPI0021216F2B|nr:IQ domain-containing protein K-like [Leptidea sinapis]
MAGKYTDRKAKTKESKTTTPDIAENPAAFTLPESLPCSEVDFPILLTRKYRANWQEILKESEAEAKEIEEYNNRKQEPVPKPPFQKTESDYIKSEVFTLLIPALEETLNKAKIWDALRIQKCFFNGIDHIVQCIWTNNPRHPERKSSNLHLFNMPWVRGTLMKHPRPYYPKSWLWPEEYAATLIQKTLRQYFVQREEDVQEMREFWRKLEVEPAIPEMDVNPYLSKKFASLHFCVSNSK